MVMLINCSFRGMKSNSHYFLTKLEELLELPCEHYQLMKAGDRDTVYEHLDKAHAIVLGMPLYVDSTPAQVIDWMQELYEKKRTEFSCPVYVISNMGFYDSGQMHILFEIVKNWCRRMGLVYGGGLAIGAGEMLGSLKNVPVDQGPNKWLGKGIKKIAKAVSQGQSFEDIYIEPAGFPRFLYIFAAHRGWAVQAKQNGLRKCELKTRRI